MWRSDVAILASPPPPCDPLLPEDLGDAVWWWTPDLDGCEAVYDFGANVVMFAHLRSLVLAVGALLLLVLVANLAVLAFRGRS